MCVPPFVVAVSMRLAPLLWQTDMFCINNLKCIFLLCVRVQLRELFAADTAKVQKKKAQNNINYKLIVFIQFHTVVHSFIHSFFHLTVGS